MVPAYIADDKRIQNANSRKPDEIPYSEKEFFDLDRVFSWKFVKNFPIRLHRGGKVIAGFIVLGINEIIILEESFLTSYFLTADLIPIKQVVSIMKSKNHPNKILIEVRRKSRSYALEVISD